MYLTISIEGKEPDINEVNAKLNKHDAHIRTFEMKKVAISEDNWRLRFNIHKDDFDNVFIKQKENG